MERNRLRRDDVLKRSALRAGEHGRIDFLRKRFFAVRIEAVFRFAQDHGAARATKRFVRRGRDDVGVGDRVGVEFGGDESRDMRHVDHEIRANLVRDFRKRREVELARIRAESRDDHARFVFARERAHFVHVHKMVGFAHAIRDDLEPLAAKVHRRAMREVSAMREVHGEDRVARVAKREICREVRLRAGMRLDVGVFRAKESFGALDRQRFYFVDDLVASVVAFARIAFAVLVRERRAERFQNGFGNVIFRGNELEAGLLATDFFVDQAGDFRVGTGKGI